MDNQALDQFAASSSVKAFVIAITIVESMRCDSTRKFAKILRNGCWTIRDERQS
jgi:hypothetical protein